MAPIERGAMADSSRYVLVNYVLRECRALREFTVSGVEPLMETSLLRSLFKPDVLEVVCIRFITK